MRRIAVLTSGGDAPGMNAAIRAVTRRAIERNVEVFGVRRGYAGLIEADFTPLTARDVSGIIEMGGTVLETGRCPEFKTVAGQTQALSALDEWDIDGLIVIGGDGSQKGSLALAQAGVPVNGVASTIDNDLAGSEMTIGVDTALNIALESIDRLRITASSHRRMFIVEVMGRNCGYLALTAGLAGGAEVIVTPEADLPCPEVMERLHAAHCRGKRHAIAVVAEGAHTNGPTLYQFLREYHATDFEPRLTILGHVQRGGSPGAFDRLLATRLAARATDLLLDHEAGFLIGLNDGKATPTLLAEIAGKIKPLPPELLSLAQTMQM
ncbi:MAG TPA: ATP-dependent 6-phosphofructokinase [Chthonomonadaceae bacterium]|nr:ATP-dependent 6-phosphofructokinase [Chthonomonadaceae bacterium]